MVTPAHNSQNNNKCKNKLSIMDVDKIKIADMLLDEFKQYSKIYIYDIENLTAELITKLKQEKKLSIKQISKKVGMSERTVYNYNKGTKPISVKNLAILLEMSSIQLVQTNLYKRDFWLIGCDSGSRNRICKLPLNISSDLMYLVGYLFGDGCLYSDKKTILFVDEYKEQIIKIQKILCDLFSVNSTIYKGDGKWNLAIYSKAVCLFFNKIFGMPFGEKKDRLHIPTQVGKLSDELKLCFISGLFDADAGTLRVEEYGGIPNWFRNSPNIEFVQTSQHFVEETKILCSQQKIVVTGPYFNKANGGFRLFINGKQRLKSCNLCGLFNHPIKKQRLETICNLL